MMIHIENKFKFNDDFILKNRLVMSPMTTYSSNDDGSFSDEEIAYYQARSKDVGMIITGCAGVSSNSFAFKQPLKFDNDDNLDSFKSFTTKIKKNGSKVIIQLFHGGRKASKVVIDENQEIVSASNIPMAMDNAKIPKPLSLSEILSILDDFYNATIRAINAGFDGVEIHGANAFLIQQFFSPHSNQRIDQWGGNMEKRAAFPLSVVKTIKKAVSDCNKKDFIIGYRISLEEIEEPGIRFNDTLYLVNRLANSSIDYLHLSLTFGYDQSTIFDPNDYTSLSKQIIDKVNKRKPIIGVSGINDTDDVLDALNFGYDLVASAKAIVINPNWAHKIINHQPIDRSISIEEANKRNIPKNLLQMFQEVPAWNSWIKET